MNVWFFYCGFWICWQGSENVACGLSTGKETDTADLAWKQIKNDKGFYSYYDFEGEQNYW